MFQKFQIDFQRNCALGKIRSTKIDEFILYLYTRKIVYMVTNKKNRPEAKRRKSKPS
jgi:hypothetical protein